MEDEEMKVMDLTDFIDKAIILSEEVEKDIVNGQQISSETVVALSKFIAAAQPVLAEMALAEIKVDKRNLQ